MEFPGYRSGEWLEPLGWETFFHYFEDEKLAFLYQDSMSDGTVSRFCQFVSRYERPADERVGRSGKLDAPERP